MRYWCRPGARILCHVSEYPYVSGDRRSFLRRDNWRRKGIAAADDSEKEGRARGRDMRELMAAAGVACGGNPSRAGARVRVGKLKA